VSDEELAAAQEALVNSFVFRWQSPSQVAAQLMTLEFDGLPADLSASFQRYLDETFVAESPAPYRTSRRRCCSVRPPHTPYRSPFLRAQARHISRIPHAAQ